MDIMNIARNISKRQPLVTKNMNHGGKTGNLVESAAHKQHAQKVAENTLVENREMVKNIRKDREEISPGLEALIGGRVGNIIKQQGLPYKFTPTRSKFNGNEFEAIKMEYFKGNDMGAKYYEDIIINPFVTERIIRGG